MGDTLDRLDMHADADLMARVRAGDRTAFEVIYRRHEARVFAYLWRLVRDETLAADLRQEVFLRLWRARRDWRPGGSVAGYLIRSAHTLAIDARRREQVRSRWADELRFSHPSTTPAPDTALERERLAARVNAAIDMLPDRMREVFSLKRDAGLTYREIAARLGISPKTVEVQMGNALKRLREALADLRRPEQP